MYSDHPAHRILQEVDLNRDKVILPPVEFSDRDTFMFLIALMNEYQKDSSFNTIIEFLRMAWFNISVYHMHNHPEIYQRRKALYQDFENLSRQ